MSTTTEERQRILAKLAKLKALAECPTGNVNETASAAAAMTRLLLEHRIELAELGETPASSVVEEAATPERRARSFPIWKLHLLRSLAQAHDCLSFEARRRFQMPWGQIQHEVRMNLLGQAEAVAEVRSLYHYCVEAIERLCAAWAQGRSVALRNDFRRGAAEAIGRRVLAERAAVRAQEQQRAAAAGRESRALAVLDRQLEQVQKAAAERGVVTVRQRTRPPRAQAWNAGFQAGSRVRLPGAEPARLP